MLAVFQLIETIAPTEQHRADHRRVRHRQGAGGARHPLQLAAQGAPVRGAQLRRALGNAPRLRALRPHERRVHRRRHATRRASSRSPRRGTIFLDEIGEMSPLVRSSCCACCRSASSAASAAPRKSRPTFASLPRPTATLRRWWRKASSARTSSTASTSSRSGAAAARARRGHPASGGALRAGSRPRWARASPGSLARPCAASRPTPGRATSASSRTRSSARSRSSGRRRFLSRACRSRFECSRADRQPARRRPPKLSGQRIRSRAARATHRARVHRRSAQRAGGVKVKAAELLGMSFRSFRYYMKKYDLK